MRGDSVVRPAYAVVVLTPKSVGEDYCYVTTTGRVTGKPHTIEIWFAVDGDTLYILAGGGERADWVRNLRKEPDAMVRIGDVDYRARGRIIDAGSEEDGRARRLVLAKYAPSNSGLDDWGRTALAIALDLGTTG